MASRSSEKGASPAAMHLSNGTGHSGSHRRKKDSLRGYPTASAASLLTGLAMP